MRALLAGPAFTWVILALYGSRAGSYLLAGDVGRCAYWASAMAITISVEFLIGKK